MVWLQGGPYYEVSLLLNNSSNKENIISSIVKKLNTISFQVEIVSTTQEIKDSVLAYACGYEYKSKLYRTFEIDLWVNINGKRQARLFVAELSKELIKVDFWFFGGEEDAPEWDQIGITEKDKPAFKTFLAELAITYDIIAGTIGYEVDIDGIFNSKEGYPSNQFTLKNLSLKEIEKIIKDKNYEVAIVSSQISFNKEHFIWIEK